MLVYKNKVQLIILFCATLNNLSTVESKQHLEGFACVPVIECPLYLKVLKRRPLTSESIAAIRAAHCGFRRNIEKVWCPLVKDTSEPTIGINVDLKRNEIDPHQGPQRVTRAPGTDEVTLTTTTSVEPKPTNEKINSTASSDNGVMTRSNKDNNNNNLLMLRRNKAHLFPSDEVCGRYVEDKIYGGYAIAIDEYPWTAMLMYRRKNKNNTLVPGCGGALISKRYVVTAAHCITRRKPEFVVLGEYDTKNETDCIYYDGESDCSPTPLCLKIENVTLHPGWVFAVDQRPFYNDIALLRLERDVEFNDFVAPICLMHNSTDLKIGTNLIATGWGLTEEHVHSNVKLQVGLPLVGRRDCSSRLGKRIGRGQICAGGVANKDTCKGDSGGPLMYFDPVTQTWRLFGVVSLGTSCGRAGKPAIYTWIPFYLDWIYELVY